MICFDKSCLHKIIHIITISHKPPHVARQFVLIPSNNLLKALRVLVAHNNNNFIVSHFGKISVTALFVVLLCLHCFLLLDIVPTDTIADDAEFSNF